MDRQNDTPGRSKLTTFVSRTSIALMILGLLLLPFARSSLMLSLALLVLSIGIALFVLLRVRTIEPADEALRENQILQAAAARKGILTPVTLAMESGMTIEEAIQQLHQMVELGVCRTEPDAEGTIEYIFSDFLPGGD